MALIHSATLTTDDPAFKAAIATSAAASPRSPWSNICGRQATADGAGLVSKDGHSALVQFDIKGDAATAGDRIAPVRAAVHAAQQAHPELRIEEFGDASVGRPARQVVQSDLTRPRRCRCRSR